ncbi:MAG: TrkH family potassium uptake protein [Alphaproteobacteria bacterium]|jgi:trk system potassium uptake protein TrkH|nr:TrkH family potassium uptake protein [Alphaproteobacteria bacterium]
MLIPLSVELFVYRTGGWRGFAISAFITGLVGTLLVLSNRYEGKTELRVREAFLLTAASWVATSFFAGLPFFWSTLSLGFHDCWFESVSALTTTGSTVLAHLDRVPRGILLWRALLQWLGGTGIIVMAMTILPILRIGGMQLFRNEFSDRSEKILPRLSQIASAILSIYLGFTLICAILLHFAGMKWFDAICHAMGTVSTGGLSTKDLSIGAYHSFSIELILMVFMLIGGTTFILFVKLWHRNFKAVWKDSQVRAYLSTIAIASLLATFWLMIHQDADFLTGLRHASFAVISVITSTGYCTEDYALWGAFPLVLFFLLSLIGGCTGSTSGGIKIFRFQVLVAVALSHMRQLRRSHGVYLPTYQGQKISENISTSVFTFITLYAFCLMMLAGGLSICGLDFITSLTGAASALGNLGPGLGPLIGPLGTFASLEIAPKCLLMFGMILGRLELLAILILFMPSFWRD